MVFLGGKAKKLPEEKFSLNALMEQREMARDILERIGPVLKAASKVAATNRRLVRISFGGTLLMYGTNFTHIAVAYQSFEMSAWRELTESTWRLIDELEKAMSDLDCVNESQKSWFSLHGKLRKNV